MSIANKDATAQGPGGEGGQTSKSGSHLDQGPTGAGKTKPNGSHLEQGGSQKAKTPKSGSVSNLAPQPGLTTKKSSVRGGGTVKGHSKDPAAKRSGSHTQQNPNVKK